MYSFRENIVRKRHNKKNKRQFDTWKDVPLLLLLLSLLYLDLGKGFKTMVMIPTETAGLS